MILHNLLINHKVFLCINIFYYIISLNTNCNLLMYIIKMKCMINQFLKAHNKIILILGLVGFFPMSAFSQMFNCSSEFIGGQITFSPPPQCNSNPYVLVFHDKFTCNVLDKNKWLTSKELGSHGAQSTATIDYDNGIQNMIFTNPGLILEDRHEISAFQALAIAWEVPTATAPDGGPNQRWWQYTSSSLTSMYQFGYGIYQLTAILPIHSSIDPTDAWGMIWPQFWMINGKNHTYQELDVFEFSGDAKTDWQTIHWPNVTNQCGTNCDPGNTDFGNGQPHTFTMVYTPYEIDWYVDNTLTRVSNHYFKKDPFFNTYNRAYCSDLSDPFYTYYTNPVFPNDPNPQEMIIAANPVKNNAIPSSFPVDFKIIDISYYQQLPAACTTTTTVVQSMINNTASGSGDAFNVFMGDQVIVDGTNPNPPLLVPLFKNPGVTPYMGNLEVIAGNKIVIKGNFKDSGYFVAKTDNNICNGYNGPSPIGHRMSLGESNMPITADTIGNAFMTSTNQTVSADDQLRVYPNPSNNNITIQSSTELGVINIYNALGESVFQTKSNNIEEQIDISKFASGVYSIQTQGKYIKLIKE
jgi:hypothetical protein